MRKSSIAVLAALLLIGSISCLAQSAETSTLSPKKVLGYKDAKTGLFHPVEGGQEIIPDATTTAPVTGTISITTTITLKTALPSGGVIYCQADVTAMSVSATGIVDYSEQASTKATVGGSTATCTVKVPYSWVLPAASTTTQNSYDADLSVIMINGTNVTTSAVSREHTRTIVTNGAIPGTGTTTSFTENVVL